MFVEAFAPFQDLTAKLLPWLDQSTDGSHDLSHIKRVWQNARLLAQEEEGASLQLLAAAGLLPTTPEARILQDADRLDAIGLVGVARCFYTAGRLGSSLYQPDDPAGKGRALDDKSYALDHFPKKLLALATGFTTIAGRRMARQRHAYLQEFYNGFILELGA